MQIVCKSYFVVTESYPPPKNPLPQRVKTTYFHTDPHFPSPHRTERLPLMGAVGEADPDPFESPRSKQKNGPLRIRSFCFVKEQ